jgi:hypothetical protein
MTEQTRSGQLGLPSPEFFSKERGCVVWRHSGPGERVVGPGGISRDSRDRPKGHRSRNPAVKIGPPAKPVNVTPTVMAGKRDINASKELRRGFFFS